MRHSIMNVSVFALSAFAILMMASCHQSYQEKADKFKQSLGEENIILAEVIDSTAQKIFYHNTTSLQDDKGNIKDYELSIYDVETQKTTVLKLDGVKEILSAKQYATRLFFSGIGDEEVIFGDDFSIIHRIGYLFFYDLTDDSIHYVKKEGFHGEGAAERKSDMDVTFGEKEILVTLHVMYSDLTQNIDYTIFPNLPDFEYQRIVEKMKNEYDFIKWNKLEKAVSEEFSRRYVKTIQEKYKSDNHQNDGDCISSSQQRLEQANQEYFQYINEYNSTSDYMWKMQRLQAAYNANERCIGLARELGNQSVLNGFLQRKAALESMGVR